MATRRFSTLRLKGPKANTKAARLERRRLWCDQLASAPAQQKAIDGLLSDGQPRPHRRSNEPIDTKMTNQVLAAEERVWRSKWAMRLRRDGRRAWLSANPTAKWADFRKYAVTLASPEWIVPLLDPKRLPKIRKQFQRQSKRLCPSRVVIGVIDFCPIRDDIAGVKGWAFHIHAVIQLAGTSRIAHQEEIKKAFPYKKALDRGVDKGRVVVPVFDAAGWDHYQDKAFQLHGVRQRITRPDSVTGKRRKTHKPELTRQQQLEVARFFQQIRASDLMIWVGCRRYGNEVRRMQCHRSK